jgi:hypothetical protein
MIKRNLLSLFLLFVSLFVFAQDSKEIKMADTMRSNGKIYVVVAVVITIFTGIICYLIRLDRKISKLEKNINS